MNRSEFVCFQHKECPCLVTKRNPSLNFRVVLYSCTLMYSILSSLFPSCFFHSYLNWQKLYVDENTQEPPHREICYLPSRSAPPYGWVDIADFCKILVSSLKGILHAILEALKHAESPPTSTLSFPTLTNEIRSESISRLETFLGPKVKTFSQEVT